MRDVVRAVDIHCPEIAAEMSPAWECLCSNDEVLRVGQTSTVFRVAPSGHLKTYRVELTRGGHTLIQAVRAVEEAAQLNFFRGETTIASYPRPKVKRWSEANIVPESRTLFSPDRATSPDFAK